MTIISAPHSFSEENLYVDLQPIFGRSLFLKCEAFNFPGSVKLKAANSMVEGAEREGILKPGSALVESSSGNLGLALSIISAKYARIGVNTMKLAAISSARCAFAKIWPTVPPRSSRWALTRFGRRSSIPALVISRLRKKYIGRN